MKVAICGSVNFAEKIKQIENNLRIMGHEPVLPKSIIEHALRNADDAEKLKEREDYILSIKPRYTQEHFNEIKNSDAILVVNMDKKGIKNYIGGATFAEIMLAFHYKKKIFFLNPIPTDGKLSPYLDELKAVKPFVINGNLGLVK